MIRFWLIIFALASTDAQAQNAEPDWNRVDDNMHTVFKVGTSALWGGLIGGIVGGINGQPIIIFASQLAISGGTVARTSASLRQRRSIAERGVEVSSTWGYSSWGFMALSTGLSVGATAYSRGVDFDENGNPPNEAMGPLVGFQLGGLAANIGVLLSASKQMRVNSRQRRLLGQSRVGPLKPTTIRWTPMFETDGTKGIAVTALF